MKTNWRGFQDYRVPRNLLFMRCVSTQFDKVAGVRIWRKKLYNVEITSGGYNSKPVRECTEHLNGCSAPAQVRSAHAHFKWLHQAWCARTISVKKWYDKPSADGCSRKKCALWEQWSSDLFVSRILAKHSNIQSENTRFKTLSLSLLTTIHIIIADSFVLLLCFWSLWAFCQAVLLLTHTVATKIGNYPELDPWNIIHILGFITAYFFPIYVMIVEL